MLFQYLYFVLVYMSASHETFIRYTQSQKSGVPNKLIIHVLRSTQTKGHEQESQDQYLREMNLSFDINYNN